MGTTTRASPCLDFSMSSNSNSIITTTVNGVLNYLSSTPPPPPPFLFLLALSLFALPPWPAASAQFAPSSAANLTTIQSPINPDITISYKSPDGACETAFDRQKQYTGWVSVPGDYPANLFFWFVEAREPTDALTVWLNGGPGSSSLLGMFNGVGPCEVREKGRDEYETVANEWGWDRASNMLFVDQPNQVGFSYDVPRNVTLNLLNGTEVMHPPRPPPAPRDGTSDGTDAGDEDQDLPPWAYVNATLGSQDKASVPNTTQQAAMAVWHLLQGFLATFPEYNPPDNAPVGVNLFAESYGGIYGPVFLDVWRHQNRERRVGAAGVSANSSVDIHLASLGIVNGCVDYEIQMPHYPSFAAENTYGFEALSPLRAKLANDSAYADDGCLALVRECRTLQGAHDPSGSGGVESVREACAGAHRECVGKVQEPYNDAGRSVYDMAASLPDSFPPSTYAEYLNTLEVQTAVGAVTNFTQVSRAVHEAFSDSGDHARGDMISRLTSLLGAGVRVALVYGDRDYICNWAGGEAVADAVADGYFESGLDEASSPGDVAGGYSRRYRDAGYAPIIVNSSYIGGVVRQYGNLSFSRVYQAGHALPAYQPETAFQIFARIALGTSVSTGDAVDLSEFATEGDDEADEHEDDLPDSPGSTCWVRDLTGTCSEEQREMFGKGEGVVINGVLYEDEDDWPLARATASGDKSDDADGDVDDDDGDDDGKGNEDEDGDGDGGDGDDEDEEKDSNDSDDEDDDEDGPDLTGVYTATATPDPDDGAVRLRGLLETGRGWLVSCALVAFWMSLAT